MRLRNLTVEHLAKIGEIVVIWSRTEHWVNFAFAGLLHVDQYVARTITTPIMNFYTRVDILEVMAKQRVADEALLAEFLDILSDVRTAYQHRNEIVHGAWEFGEDHEPLLIRAKKKHLPMIDVDAMPISELEKKLTQIDKAGLRLGEFLFDHGWRPTDISLDTPRGLHPHVTQRGEDANEK